jgi:hypothetical protein
MTKNKKILFLLCILGLHYVFHQKFTDIYSKDPFEAPINLNDPQKIKADIYIPMSQNYSLSFEFSREGQNYGELKNIVGSASYSKHGELIPSGIIIPVRWSLYSKETNKLLVEKEKRSCCWSSSSRKAIGRIIDQFSVPSGYYIFEMEALKPVPEFNKITTKIKIGYSPKNGSTWHSGYVWWGMIFNAFIALPLAFFCTWKLLSYIFWRLTRY